MRRVAENADVAASKNAQDPWECRRHSVEGLCTKRSTQKISKISTKGHPMPIYRLKSKPKMHFGGHLPDARIIRAPTVMPGSTVHRTPGLLRFRHVTTEQATVKPATILVPRGPPQTLTRGAPDRAKRASTHPRARLRPPPAPSTRTHPEALPMHPMDNDHCTSQTPTTTRPMHTTRKPPRGSPNPATPRLPKITNPK